MTTVEAMHAQNTPTRIIADRLGLAYRKVYDYLLYAKLRPIPMPKTHCRRGHDLAVVGTTSQMNGKGHPSGYCRACRRMAWSRYNKQRRSET